MKIIENSLIYLSFSFISKAAPYLLLPFLTSYLEPTEFGKLSIFLVVNSLCVALIGMSMQANITKNFFNKSKYELSLIIGNIFFILIASTIFYFVIILIITLLIKYFFSIPSHYLLIAPVIALLTMINQIYLAILQIQGRAYIFGTLEMVNTFLITIITLIFLIYIKTGWVSQVIGIFASNLFICFISIIYLLKQDYLCLKFDKTKVVKILKLSIPLIPHVLGGLVIVVSDRFFIEKIVGIEAVAIYSVAYSFGLLVSLFTDSFVKAWSPWFHKQLTDLTIKKKFLIVKLTYVYAVSVFIVAYLISLISKNILPIIIDNRYADAVNYIWWIGLGYAIQGIYKIFYHYLLHINKTMFLALSTSLAAIANLFLNYFFVNMYGAIGAAYATAIAFFISAILVFEYQRRNFPMPWLLK